MFRWHILAGAALTIIAAAALGFAFRSRESTDQEMELTASTAPTADPDHFGFTVSAAPVDDLYPGAERRLKLTLTNPYTFDLRVNGLRVELVGTSNPGCDPVAANLEVQPYTGTFPVLVGAGDSEQAGTVPLRMPNTVANACQRAVFTLTLNADATRVDSR